MRTKNSLKNSILSMFYTIITIIIGLISQSIFVKTLGSEYNGIKSLFSNILSMLSVAELGFGSAIVFNLYKPFKEKNIEDIKSYLKYYKSIYTNIGLIILFLGIIILPIIPKIVRTAEINDNLYILFLLFLLNSVFSYLLTYKRSVLYADQKNYIINIINIIYVFIVNVLEIIILLLTKNFKYYLIIKIIFTIMENLTIHYIVNIKYPYLKNINDAKSLSRKNKKEITKKVKGLLFHKIGGFIVNGTDNIIISMSNGLGIIYVGLYSNYSLIILYVNRLFGDIFTGLTASVGNLLIDNDYDKSRSIYKSMLLMNSWIYCFCSISIFMLIEPFIEIWLGKEYLLSKFVLLIIVINFYIQGLRKTSMTFKDAAGIYYEDRFVPIVESAVNLIFSILLVKRLGLAGVFLGTIISTSILFFYSYPKFVYKKILNGNYFEYAKLYIKHIIISILIFMITFVIVDLFHISNLFILILFRGIILLLVPNLIYLMIFWKDKDFEYFKQHFSEIKTKFINKNKRMFIK